MIISLIVAMDEKGGIGKNDRLPWHIATDLKRFKQLTMGHHLIMGRKTYQTIGKPLAGRSMIIVTHQISFHPIGCTSVNSIDAAIQLAQARRETEAFIIGGGEIFQQAIDIADRIYLTTVYANVLADVFFPIFNWDQWEIVESNHAAQGSGDDYKSDFKVLRRKH